MATNDTLQFVDSVSASATLRLDINDGVKWECEVDSLDFSPPPLRRAINGTLLTDGSVQSASAYDNRVLRMQLSLVDSTVDTIATDLQTLHRELDRDTNFLKWQPSGATSPVFFRTLRSAVNRITETASRAMTLFDVEILAEPFALGVREDVGPTTVNNDPAAGSNGLYLDISSVKGDVATPAFIENTNTAASKPAGLVAVRQHGTPSDFVHFLQCESLTLGADTTNPGAGPDAAMSGTGTNNYVRTSFATTATNTSRVTWTPAPTVAQAKALRGKYRLFACVRRTDNTSVMTIQALTNTVTNTAVTIPLVTNRLVLDLGLINLGANGPATPGKYAAETPPYIDQLFIYAARTSGAGSLDFDFLFFAPADEALMLFSSPPFGGAPGNIAGKSVAVDGPNETVYGLTTTASPFAGTTVIDRVVVPTVGGFPSLMPGQTNRLFWVQWNDLILNDRTVLALTNADTATVTVSYFPRYLYVRPAST